MSKKNVQQPVTKITEADKFIFGEKLSSMSASQFAPQGERDLRSELFANKSVMEQVDAYEQEMGFSTKGQKNLKNLRYRNKLFSMSNDEDRALYNELINDAERYQIFWFEKNWTVHGDFKMFVVYTENLDAKPNGKKEEVLDEENAL